MTDRTLPPLRDFSLLNPKVIFAALFLSILTLGIYLQTAGFLFTNFDDPLYVIENNMVHRGLTWGGLLWAFQTTVSAEWIPVTWISYMIDYEFFGLDAGAFHLSSVFIHLSSVILLFLILYEMTGSFFRSAAAAALFAVHPLRVESVAWIAERKDVLSLFFMLLTIKAYQSYVMARKPHAFSVMIFFFACGLMSKPMLMTLPFGLLLLDYWPFGRMGNIRGFPLLVAEKKLMIAMSLITGIVNYIAVDRAGGIASFEMLPFADRVQNAAVSYVRYLTKTFWPVDLAHFYPYQKQYLTWGIVMASGALITGLTAFSIRQRKKTPAFLVGWLWFLGTLVPVIGIIQAGAQSIADRYTYIPHVGLAVALIWGAAALFEKWRFPVFLRAGIFGFAVIALAALSWQQTHHWRNSMRLNLHAMKVTEANYIAHENLAYVLAKRKRFREAKQHYVKALEIEPNRVRNLHNLGLIALKQAKYAEAEKYFIEVLKMRPQNIEALNSLGVTALKTGRFEQASGYFMQALTLSPQYAPARKGLAYVYIQKGQYQEAQYHLDSLTRDLADQDMEVLVLKGLLAAGSQQYKQALEIYQKILSLQPNNIDALFAAGNAHLNLKNISQAISYYEKALNVDGNLSKVHKNLGIAYFELGEYKKAEKHFKTALEIRPDFARVHYRWGMMLADQEKWDEAQKHFLEAKRINPEVPGLKQAFEALLERKQRLHPAGTLQ